MALFVLVICLLTARAPLDARAAVSAEFPSPSLVLAPQAQPQPQQQQQPPVLPTPPTPPRPKDQQGQSTPSRPGSGDQSIDSVVSIDRIRKALERQPVLTFVMPDPTVPRYRIEIQGGAFKPMNFLNSFYIPPTPAPVPLGGVDYYEMQRLNTPSQFWGSAPFTNKDLLGMAALNGAYSLVGALIKKGLEAQASAAQARAHQEVQQELQELAEHNARIAAGQADGTAGDKKETAKKSAEKEKQKEKQKKK